MANYTLEKEIGRGGMGAVFYGHTPTGQPTAIKMLESQFVSIPHYRKFFESEARALSTMSHPSVVKVMGDTFSDEKGNLYLPMEYVEGETMQQRVARLGPYTEAEARQVMGKILDAFSYIHSMGKVHRDIKPSNIIIRPNGDICVIDFGIAKDMKVSSGMTIGTIVGTDGYMSPEQVKGLSIDTRTDIYSLGCLLHYMLTGQHAIVKQSNDMATKMVILNNVFPRAKDVRPELSDDIQNIILRAVDKDMTQRYQEAAAFRAAILGEPEGGTRMSGCFVTVGRQGCDVNVGNNYVSSKHLTITYKEYAGSPTGHIIEIADHSTNGTGINGRYLHKGTMSFPYDPANPSAYPLPEVCLAGRPEILLQWEKVLAKMSFATDDAHPTKSVQQTTQTTPPPPSPSTEKLGVGLAILSFFFPVVGWVLWGIWRTTKPDAARTAATVAWIGFAVGIVYNLIVLLAF